MLNALTREVAEPRAGPSGEDLIAETGCRLCPYFPPKNKKSAWERTFHACWDPNDSSLLYIFSQNGMLKIINTTNGTEKYFHLLFRRFSPSNMSSEERPVRKHWDKVSLTPGKPGEIIFLMGVSNTVHMTAVPGSLSALAELTDDSSDNFAYGSPVLQIYTHPSRVTSLCMSPFGQVLASGDENGYINLVNCALPTSVIDKEPAEWWQCPSATPSHQNPVVRAHNGPIFSLQWLPIFHKSPDTNIVKYHYLATGSEDRMVRLWQVTLGHHRSVSVKPLMVLDTQSTHVLCLKAVRQPKAQKTMQGALSQWSQRRASTVGSIGGGSVASLIDVAECDADGAGGLDTIYLCAGTEHGSVYMWRFNSEDCGKRFEVENSGLDDGTRLLAVLHSSNRPVMSIAVTFKREPPLNPPDDEPNPQNIQGIAQARPSFMRKSSAASVVSARSTASRWRAAYGTAPPPQKLVMCVSDTVGIVRSYVLHKQAEDRDMSVVSGAALRGAMKKISDTGLRTLTSLQSFDPEPEDIVGGSENRGSVSVFGRRRASGLIEEEQNEIEGLMLTGESQFSSPVVACLFQEPRRTRTRKELELVDEQTREHNRQMNFSNLASSMTDLAPPIEAMGTLPTEHDAERSDGVTGANSLVVVQAADEIRFYPILSLLSTRKSTAITALGAMLASIDEQSVNSDAAYDEVASRKPVLQEGFFMELPDQIVAPKIATTTTSIAPATRVHREQNSIDIAPPEPNQMLPPPPSPLPVRDAVVAGRSSAITRSSTQSKAMNVTRSIKEDEAGVITTTSTTTTAIKRMGPDELQSGETRNQNSAARISAFTQKTTEDSSKVVNDSGLVKQRHSLANMAVCEKLSSRQMTNNDKKLQSTALPLRSRLATVSAPSSEFATPALNSSEVLLAKYQAALNEDSFSIASVHTTSSYRNEASRLVTSVPSDNNMFGDLISVGSDAIRRRMPKAINVKKQVDEEWLRSRRECGPSVEDLRALLPSEPCVEIGVKVKGSGKRSEGVSQTCSTSFGLRASVDEETLQINYRLDFDPNDIFGELSTGLGGSAGMDASWKKLEAIDYMLGRSILLSSTM